MDVRAATSLIAAAVPGEAGVWADLGAGGGTFTLALATLLPAGSRIFAVDTDAAALAQLRAQQKTISLGTEIETHVADFRAPLALPTLDGMLMANALHFVAESEQGTFLQRSARLLRGGGRVILVDYDGRGANAWVPFPVPKARFSKISSEIGWPQPTFVGSLRSRYGGDIYAAYVDVPRTRTGGSPET